MENIQLLNTTTNINIEKTSMNKYIQKYVCVLSLLAFICLRVLNANSQTKQPELLFYPSSLTFLKSGQTLTVHVSGDKVMNYSSDGNDRMFRIEILDNGTTMNVTYTANNTGTSSNVISEDRYGNSELYIYDRSSFSLICKYPVSFLIQEGLKSGSIDSQTRRVEKGKSPGGLTSVASASCGNGTYHYQWQESSDGEAWYDIPGATGTTYSCPILVTNRYYRRSVKSGTVVKYSNIVSIEVIDMDNIPLNNENYILTRTMQDDAASVYTDKIEYFDGLGRPMETVLKGFSPSKKDIVTYQEYDEVGRQNKQWSAVPIASSSGYADLSALQTASQSFYGDSKVYQETAYEPSPLNRVLKQLGPGQAWQNADKSVKTNYLTNTSTGNQACTLFEIQADQTSIQNKGLYANSELFVTQLTDEDNHTVYEFKDKQDHVVLKRTMNGNEQQDSYFVYDDFDHLRYVLPPNASDLLTATNASWNMNSQPIQDFAYYYEYDSHDNCILKKLPGCQPVVMKFDKADRMIFSQDGNQRHKGEWTFLLYDVFGRQTVSGVLKSVVPPDISNMIVSSEFRGTGGLAGYTTNINIPSSNLLTVNYYDDYQFIDMMSAQEKAKMVFASTSGYDAQYAGGAKGLLTGIRTYQLNEPNKYTVLANYYDYRGRIVQTHATNHLGGFEDEYMAYNFTGTVKHRKHVHAAAGQPIQTEIYSYTYDHAERLLTVSHKLNDFQEKPLLVNSYDEIGRLRTQKKASKTSSYTYNVRNWMTAITGNLFNETLTYNVDVDGLIPQTPTFNGNISAMKWKLSGVDNIYRGYQFSYDQNNRLTKALYGEGNNISINNKYNELLTYDATGNILTLQRNGKHDSGFGLIDNLTYTYNGNQLSKVTDAATAATTHYGAFQFVDGANVETEYVYDANGNLTQDYNKKISKIEYNSLNLPSKLQFSEGHMAEYGYDAVGKKLSVTYTTSKTNLMVPMGSIVPPQATNVAMTLKTDYCGNMIYENGKLTKILTDVGYITLNSGGEPPMYHYFLTDHLGNNRVVVQENGAVEQINQYYAFGGLMGDSSGDYVQPYKYNGKELDRMHGLDWYDYGARHYDAALGRWMCMDPLTEKYYDVSPYAYCGNNPVNAIDEEGKKILFVNGYYNSLFKSLNMGPSRGSEEYWSTNFYINAQRFFNDYSAYDRRNFIDACSNPFSSGTDRFKLGREYAEKHYKDIVSNLGKDESISMVTHSQGAAYGAGIIDYLLEKGVRIGIVLHLSAHQGNQFKTPEKPFTIQYSYDKDWVTKNLKIKGSDVQIINTKWNSDSESWKYAHGQTNTSKVFDEILKALDVWSSKPNLSIIKGNY